MQKAKISMKLEQPSKLSYRAAGVNIDAGNRLVDRIKPHVERTTRKELLSGLGGFGALFRLPNGYRKPVLVSGADGVGTKVKLAIEYNLHNQIGHDLVAMCVNDLIVSNAEPLFFLDYYATGHLDVDIAESVVASIADACEISGCALAGGETAEMPGMYNNGDYDLAGFCVGVVEEDSLLDGSQVREGHVIIGLPSSGPHSNGFSLIRNLFAQSKVAPDALVISDGESLLDAVMKPTRIYVKSVLTAMKTGLITGATHITGGGFQENLPRSYSDGLAAEINLSSWVRPDIFHWLDSVGNLGGNEMLRTFNCGIGFTLFCDESHASTVMEILRAEGESPKIIGRFIQRKTKSVVFKGSFN